MAKLAARLGNVGGHRVERAPSGLQDQRVEIKAERAWSVPALTPNG
jgi:hypothetical protein